MFHEDREIIRESFEDFSRDLGGHHIGRNKRHGVEENLFLALCAIIYVCEGWCDMERYGKLKLDFLCSFLSYTHGVPSDDTLRRFLEILSPRNFNHALQIGPKQWA